MNKEKVCIATICWARNEEEETLLRSSLQALADLSIPTFITDGGSNASFLAFVKSIPHFTLLQAGEKGVQAQAKTSLTAASKSSKPFIFYTEPDKEQFFRKELPDFLGKAPGDEATGIFLAARSAKAFATFPFFQQMTETTINNCCTEVTGKDFDFTYGPFIVNTKLVQSLDDVHENIGWGWRPYVFIMAYRMGLSVNAYIGDFHCPPDQGTDDPEERIYRMRQLEQNIRGIVLAASTKF